MTIAKAFHSKHLCLPLTVLMFFSVCACFAAEMNTLSKKEKDEGFELLFDGKSMDKWRNYRSDTIKDQWKVVDGTMFLDKSSGKSTKLGGDIVTKQKYGFFDFRIEWKISENGNSGIMFRVNEETKKRLPWMDAPEFQLKDPFRKAMTSAGALYKIIPTKKGIAKPAGQWNTSRILLEPGKDDTGKLKCWLNGHKTIDVVIDRRDGSDWLKLIEKSNKEQTQEKFIKDEEFLKVKTGPILLQDHGSNVSFRNIRIKNLDCPAGCSISCQKAKGYKKSKPAK